MSSKGKALNPRQLRFVAEYLKDSNGTRAAIAAGYAPKGAGDRAHDLLTKSPAVMAEVERHRKSVQVAAQYNLEKAMLETDEAIKEAKEARQYSAVAKLIEHKARLNGLLIDKHDVLLRAGFMVKIVGVERE